MRAEMHRNSDKPIIKWLELAISPRWQEEDAVAAVHPLHLSEPQPCFGVTLDHRWLCSSDGALTVFDSMAAATRFLHLLNMDRLTMGGRRDGEAPGPNPFQCFHLDAKGLTVCSKCPAGDHAHWRAAWDDSQCEERW
jgi:hypothetical protein